MTRGEMPRAIVIPSNVNLLASYRDIIKPKFAYVKVQYVRVLSTRGALLNGTSTSALPGDFPETRISGIIGTSVCRAS
jgi:hypothetical protein